MEKLQLTGESHRALRHAGADVLRITLPTLTGDTPAAMHTKAVLTALSDFAETTLLPAAREALFHAAKSGKLFAFHPFHLQAAFTSRSTRRGLLLTLCLSVKANGQETVLYRHFLWTADETLRKKISTRTENTEKTKKKRIISAHSPCACAKIVLKL